MRLLARQAALRPSLACLSLLVVRLAALWPALARALLQAGFPPGLRPPPGQARAPLAAAWGKAARQIICHHRALDSVVKWKAGLPASNEGLPQDTSPSALHIDLTEHFCPQKGIQSVLPQ